MTPPKSFKAKLQGFPVMSMLGGSGYGIAFEVSILIDEKTIRTRSGKLEVRSIPKSMRRNSIARKQVKVSRSCFELASRIDSHSPSIFDLVKNGHFFRTWGETLERRIEASPLTYYKEDGTSLPRKTIVEQLRFALEGGAS